ncbi:pentatricopeptide repeat-containing protein At3g12770 isoform X2 [Amborella trichopoda]|nr:pentatricopeptide repeat-containing protein At3g12770 isoform X2 [Amborella trichopoda]|eukprot:XP_020523012.1 pentatricopeptide repeat-containing protein At3g12770 isoform X2 [Amborella trichopoda]
MLGLKAWNLHSNMYHLFECPTPTVTSFPSSLSSQILQRTQSPPLQSKLFAVSTFVCTSKSQISNYPISPRNCIFDTGLYQLQLQSCKSLEELKQIHTSLLISGILQGNPHWEAQIISKYAKFGHLSIARSFFDRICGNNSFLWNTMTRAYAQTGFGLETIELYARMIREGIKPNNYTYPFVLKACAMNSWLRNGRLVHQQIIRSGFQSDSFVEAGLVDMYSKCGQNDDARKVFDNMLNRDLVSWTAMITGYEQAELPDEALMVLWQMQGEGLMPDSVCVVSVASAIAQLGNLQMAKSLHAFVILTGFVEDLAVENSLLAMYAKCGSVKIARLVFNRMAKCDGITWNAMMTCYDQNGHAHEALKLFDHMKLCGPKPNSVSVLIALSACAYLGALHIGRQVHGFMENAMIKPDMMIWNSLVDMYAKCGDLDCAIWIFESMPKRDVSSWNVMISGYGNHGHGKEAMASFSRMCEEGINPNHITYTCLLSACSHAGLLEEGRKLFENMTNETLLMPMVKHYACMVDLLGRAGHLDEAHELIKQMPSKPNDGVWGALLGACRIHGNTRIGEYAAQNLFRIEPEHAGYYVLMSNIYAASNHWEEVGKLRGVMKSKGLKKPAACSMIELEKEIHVFHSSDWSHPQSKRIQREMERLVAELKRVGYVPDTSCVLHDVEEEDKEHILNSHSEKLAIAFGLMNIHGSMPIRITKNLRVCGDCHSAFKFISSIYTRKIVVRDANRFHHFQDGVCSCKDY